MRLETRELLAGYLGWGIASKSLAGLSRSIGDWPLAPLLLVRPSVGRWRMRLPPPCPSIRQCWCLELLHAKLRSYYEQLLHASLLLTWRRSPWRGKEKGEARGSKGRKGAGPPPPARSWQRSTGWPAPLPPPPLPPGPAAAADARGLFPKRKGGGGGGWGWGGV
jgi:hypothetical protein